MARHPLAIPASLLLLALALPSHSQTNADAPDLMALTRLAQEPSQPVPSESPAIQRQLSAEEMAALHMVRKEYRAAAEIFKRLSDENPHNPIYLNRLGIALHEQAELRQALKYYQQALKVDSHYADAQNNIGTIWYERKKYAKAIRAYQKAIALQKDTASFYLNLGYAYFAEKKYEESITSFRQALALDPVIFEGNPSRVGTVMQDRSVSSDRGRFYFLLAKSFAQSGNAERCALYLRKAKEEGYKEINAVRTDPAFAAVLKDPAIQEVVAPKPVESVEP